jgi:ribosome-associated protein
LDDDKAADPVVIDLAGRTSIADYMVVASGTSSRHVQAMAEHLVEKLEAKGLKGIRIEGADQGDWVLIDGGDIIVHLFKPEARTLYGLEKMWGADWDAPVAATA